MFKLLIILAGLALTFGPRVIPPPTPPKPPSVEFEKLVKDQARKIPEDASEVRNTGSIWWWIRR